MAQHATLIDKTTRGMAFVLDENSVASIVKENAAGAEYRDEEDTNRFFLFATGGMAQLGHSILRDSRPFDTAAADVSKDPSRGGIWSFDSEVKLRAAFNGITGVKSVNGTAFMFNVDRKALRAAA